MHGTNDEICKIKHTHTKLVYEKMETDKNIIYEFKIMIL